ncbi:MAG TPA: triphosphoribosyl-dephospho-CoA synthase, partial [Thermoleophilia bacterium]|nr:triphosphoribosyl-dephospho-CoA synthase [Thermoleophilia bacterium]
MRPARDPAGAAMEPLRGPEIARAARLACLIEASVPKPGNVSPQARFADTTYADLVASAGAIAPALAEAGQRGVGETVLRAVRDTRRVAASNTNLGIVLLLAPLAKAAAGGAA